MLPGLELMAVQRTDAAFMQLVPQRGRQVVGKGARLGGASRRRPPDRKVGRGVGIGLPKPDEGFE